MFTLASSGSSVLHSDVIVVIGILKNGLPTNVLMKCGFTFIERTLVNALNTEGQAEVGFVFFEVETAESFVDYRRYVRMAKVQSCFRRKNR